MLGSGDIGYKYRLLTDEKIRTKSQLREIFSAFVTLNIKYMFRKSKYIFIYLGHFYVKQMTITLHVVEHL